MGKREDTILLEMENLHTTKAILMAFHMDQ